MIKKTIEKYLSSNGYLYSIIIYKIIKSNYNSKYSKNDLPCELCKYNLTYYWRINDIWYRDNDLPDYINLYSNDLDFCKYDVCYRYMGYGKRHKYGNEYKFINGICCELLKESLDIK